MILLLNKGADTAVPHADGEAEADVNAQHAPPPEPQADPHIQYFAAAPESPFAEAPRIGSSLARMHAWCEKMNYKLDTH